MIVGIDLGTTNSLIAIWNSIEPKVIPNALGKMLTPSVISVDDNDAILIGEPALNRLITHPEATAINFKRLMGSDTLIKLGSRFFRPEELSALILKRLKEDAESYLGCAISEAVISVPAYFSDAQRKATKIAGKLAGLKVERLINEPTAAGIAYGLQEQVNETNYMIFDLGGGTFDVSILTMFSGIIEVRASSGDNFLGGLDFTKILEEMFIKHIKITEKMKDKNFPAAVYQKIQEQAELAKYKLSINVDAVMQISWNEKIFELEVTSKDFEVQVEPLLQRLREPVKKVLSDSKLSSTQINQIILVGGATRMAVVKKLVTRLFGKLPSCYIDPDVVVVQGVAIQAGLKANDKALDELVVTDVCPYTLGIAVYNKTRPNTSGVQHFDPIIERNTIIPTSRSRRYFPTEDNQEYVDIRVYQGEHFNVDKNIFLGNLRFALPKGLKNPEIDVRFTYDINGLLEVEATIVETQIKNSIVIEGNPGVLNEQQIRDSLNALQDLKIHPREQTENMILLSQAEKLYEELKGDKRLLLSSIIKEFLNALDEQNQTLIIKIRKQLEQTLIELRTELSSL